MKLYANLHNHTTHSDGIFTPTELVKVAKEEGYKAVVATDHDTVTAYDEMKAACAAEGLETIFGCEFYANCKQYIDYFLDYHLTYRCLYIANCLDIDCVQSQSVA